ncbi:MAG TPA: prolipoprotein diacylglyceryl transferase family protein [Candidatus Limnocylindrales bacterium]|nr:prolipoprotein diacylglyceryl transferase family protein [Candidatus Limnocylindrales bacterium]
MPIAVVELAFEPQVAVAGLSIRLEQLALTGVLLVALGLAAVLAGRTPTDGPGDPALPAHLGRDDLLFVALGAVPGALAGGRLGYVLVHLDYYSAQPAAILDPGQGSLQLSLGVLGGLATAAPIARLFEAPVGRWLHVAALPLLVAIGGGKLAMALSGDGQGLPADVPWATRYSGPGPWESLGPAIPSHPAQIYEGLGTLVLAGLLGVAVAAGAFGNRDGRLFWVALAGWATVRLVAAATWRDPAVVAGLRVDQLLSLGLVGLSLAALVGLVRRARRPVPVSSELAASPPVDWPDPESARSWWRRG